MICKLTKRAIDQLTETGKDQFFWDEDLPGFGIKVTPTGSKIYVLQYRMGGRSTSAKRYTIVRHGVWTVDQARNEARRLLGLIATGHDPAQVKQESQNTLTLSAFAERYLNEHATLHKKPRSVQEDRQNLKNRILPKLGTRRLDKVTRSDIAKLHHDLRDTPISANRCLALLKTMFSLAERWGLRPDGSNPCRHVQKYKEYKRERFLSQQELARLGRALSKAEREKTHSPQVIAAIRLLIYTGARLSEILTLKWEYILLDQGWIRLPESKTGAKTIYLNPPALEVLDSLIRIEGNPYVLPGLRPRSHLVNIQAAWRLIRKEADLEDVRLHDLRHSFATVGTASNLSLPIIGGLLGHSHPATTQRYAHVHNDPLKRATYLIGEQIQAAMTGKPQAPVVPIKGARNNTQLDD